MKEKILSFSSLFGSGATLLCCAIPALLSVVAGGAAVGSFLSVFPWVVPLSKHKEVLFVVSGTLLIINAVFVFQPKGRISCAVTGGKGCEVAGSFTRTLFWASILLYGIGFFSAYALVSVIRLFGG